MNQELLSGEIGKGVHDVGFYAVGIRASTALGRELEVRFNSEMKAAIGLAILYIIFKRNPNDGRRQCSRRSSTRY